MENTYTVIDINNWKRAMHCMVFRNAVEPQYCISLELDVTNFCDYIKRRNLSFTYSFVYIVTKCANEIEEFRYRFKDGDIILYDSIDTSFTYLDKETELFKVVTVPMQDSLEEYVKLAKKTQEDQKEYFTGPLGNDVYQFSGLPWISFTHVSHTNSGKKDNATPLFDWGKYTKRNGRLYLPFEIQAHHSFIDGLHMGRLAKRIQDYIDQM